MDKIIILKITITAGIAITITMLALSGSAVLECPHSVAIHFLLRDNHISLMRVNHKEDCI